MARAKPSYLEDARTLFVALAARHGLVIEIVEGGQVDVSATLAAQPGLDFEVMLNLQEGDELHLYVGGASFCAFPFPQQRDHFAQWVDGLLAGTCRVRATYGHFSFPFKATLECVNPDGTWSVKTRYGALFTRLPFTRAETRILRNGFRDPA